MYKGTATAGLLALRPDVGLRAVPAEHEPGRHARTRSPARTTRSSTARRSQDPGGLPLGTLEYLTFDRFYNVAGQPFTGDAAPEGRPAARSPAGTAALTVPAGWTVDAAEADRPDRRRRRVDRRRSPSRRARRRSTTNFKVSALFTARRGDRLHGQRRARRARPSRAASTAGASGPSTTAGSTTLAPQALPARPLGGGRSRSAWARRSRSRSTSTTGRRRRRAARSRSRCRPASRPTRRRKPYGPLAPGADTTVNFTLDEHGHDAARARRPTTRATTTLQKTIGIATSYRRRRRRRART